jgi:hypothetical protein
MVDDIEELLRELNALWQDGGGNSNGRRWTREELHERREIVQCENNKDELSRSKDAAQQ